MKLLAITYQGRTMAAATARRFFLCDELLERPPRDPETVFVCFMCCFARELLAGKIPGDYSEPRARRFARSCLIPDEVLERPLIDARRTAAALGVPTSELLAAWSEADAAR